MHSSTYAPLAGRVAAITGGARGIGFELARAFALHGAKVALWDRLDTVDAAAASLAAETGATVIAHHLDVTQCESIADAFDDLEERVGVADILLNSAGITSGEPALTLSAAEWSQVMNVNVTGTFLVCQTFAQRYSASTGRPDPGMASIVNMSSMSSFAVNIPQTQAVYNASKAAVSMLTSSLAIEWLPLGIRVNAMAPGYVASDMTRDFVAAHPQLAADWISKIPIGRMAQPSELSALAVFLAGDSANYIVGQTIIADGGYTIV
jgi:NAD(P)-dependent dehydrogenase (short-subunit alcohol dehydrogenase family)